MSVINTNYLALVSQNNLVKSQNALGTAIERLSSGLRINSAKDDAAGQAIANRFTANIKGLSQAARNSNDGISAAQTTEGALNEINNNLQRIRELSVQAANGSNSDSDLKSIQDEINQRLDEIDRVAKQTTFNGRNVLDTNGKLTVQVGSLDSEVIDISLRQINRDTLGLTKLDMENQFVSKNAAGEDNFTAASLTFNALDAETAINNTLKDSAAATWTALNDPDNITFSGFTAAYSDFVVGTADNKLYAVVDNGGTNEYYEATFDANTGKITVSTTVAVGISATNVNSTATHFDPGTGGGGLVAMSDISLSMIDTTDPVVENFYLENSAGGTTTLWAKIGASYYEVTGSAATGFSIDAATGSATPHGQIINDQTYLEALGEDGVYVDYGSVATALSVNASQLAVVEHDGNHYVRLQEGTGSAATFTYYAATLTEATGSLTLTSTTAVTINVSQNMANVDALLSGDNQLVQYAGKDGYFVQNGTGEDAKYYAAKVAGDGTVTLTRADGQAATNAAEVAQAEIMVDPLAALDRALQDVDALRSELGAVQNRFESTIANLNNTINNLSAARSRIEDADYAVEVSNMTRAQILQQAGTSVLAQANQVPQTVLSLLR